MSSAPILEVRGLSKIYPGKPAFTAVADISFRIQAGEIVGLLGPNGAGKTTTILMLLNALSPTRGSICYFGRELHSSRAEIMKQVGFASGYARLPYSLTVEENLAVYGRLFDLRGRDLWQRIHELLEQFGCLQLLKRKMTGLSAGENTRVLLAKAFIGRPKILLLDEPTASLDPEICQDVRSFVRQARDRDNVAMLYTSHNMPEVEEVCDRVMMLKNGCIIAEDTPGKLAATVGQPLLRLRPRAEQLQSTLGLLENRGKVVKLCDKWLETRLSAQEIHPLLAELVQQGITCPGVDICHPSLEDYFLKTAGEDKIPAVQRELPEESQNTLLPPLIEKRLNLYHSWAIALRYLHNFKRNGDRISDAIYWPVMDLILWGLATRWFVTSSPQGLQQHALTMMLTAIVFWQIVWRANYEISVNFLEDTWSRNVVNLFSSPLTLPEWVSGVMIVGLMKTVLSIIVGFGAAWLLYALNLLQTGPLLVPFLACLVIFGWSIGLVAAGLIVRIGRSVQTLAWMMGFLAAPLSAVYYPVSTLPTWLQPVSWCLPATWIFEGMRSVLSTGRMDWQWLAISFGLSIAYLALAMIFFVLMFEKRRKLGLQGLEV